MNADDKPAMSIAKWPREPSHYMVTLYLSRIKTEQAIRMLVFPFGFPGSNICVHCVLNFCVNASLSLIAMICWLNGSIPLQISVICCLYWLNLKHCFPLPTTVMHLEPSIHYAQ
uniref:Uncharacterized protein n=1 Tax=Picea glauca TaxID=3330 RepID=A0A117NIW6_PICGL|nr:hypothetical protein ABT39_MTgene427 [Picea glauca]